MKAAAVCHPLATSPPKNEAWPSRSLRWKGCRSNSSANRMISGPESVNVPRKCCCPLVKSSRYFNDCLSWAVFACSPARPGGHMDARNRFSMFRRVRKSSTSRLSGSWLVPVSCSSRKRNSTNDSESITRFSIRSRSGGTWVSSGFRFKSHWVIVSNALPLPFGMIVPLTVACTDRSAAGQAGRASSLLQALERIVEVPVVANRQGVQPSLIAPSDAAGEGVFVGLPPTDAAPFTEEVAMHVDRGECRALEHELLLDWGEFLHERTRAIRIEERVAGFTDLDGDTECCCESGRQVPVGTHQAECVLIRANRDYLAHLEATQSAQSLVGRLVAVAAAEHGDSEILRQRRARVCQVYTEAHAGRQDPGRLRQRAHWHGSRHAADGGLSLRTQVTDHRDQVREVGEHVEQDRL